MFAVLVLAFVVLPLVELYVIVQVADRIGVLDTLALLVVVGAVGVWVVKRQGLGVLARLQAQSAAGEVPTTPLLDGALLVLAGVLLVAPGFVTDVAALGLVLPPVRALVRALVVRRARSRLTTAVARAGGATWWVGTMGVGGPGAPRGPQRAGGEVIDVDALDVERELPRGADD